MDVLAAQVREYLAKHTNYTKTFGLGADPPVEDWGTIQWALYADALVARVTEAEQRLATAGQNASLSMGREVGWQHRAESAEAGLADARNALAFYAEADNYVALPRRVRPAIEDAGDRAREVLARLDGSSGE